MNPGLVDALMEASRYRSSPLLPDPELQQLSLWMMRPPFCWLHPEPPKPSSTEIVSTTPLRSCGRSRMAVTTSWPRPPDHRRLLVCQPATHVGYELIGAGMLIAGGGHGLPLDYEGWNAGRGSDTSAVQDHGAESDNFGQACRRDLCVAGRGRQFHRRSHGLGGICSISGNQASPQERPG